MTQEKGYTLKAGIGTGMTIKSDMINRTHMSSSATFLNKIDCHEFDNWLKTEPNCTGNINDFVKFAFMSGMNTRHALEAAQKRIAELEERCVGVDGLVTEFEKLIHEAEEMTNGINTIFSESQLEMDYDILGQYDSALSIEVDAAKQALATYRGEK